MNDLLLLFDKIADSMYMNFSNTIKWTFSKVLGIICFVFWWTFKFVVYLVTQFCVFLKWFLPKIITFIKKIISIFWTWACNYFSKIIDHYPTLKNFIIFSKYIIGLYRFINKVIVDPLNKCVNVKWIRVINNYPFLKQLLTQSTYELFTNFLIFLKNTWNTHLRSLLLNIVSRFYERVMSYIRSIIYVKDPKTGLVTNRLVYVRNRLTLFIIVMWFFSLFAGLDYFIPYFRSRLEIFDERNWINKPVFVLYKLYILLNPDNILLIMWIMVTELFTMKKSVYYTGDFWSDCLALFGDRYFYYHRRGYKYYLSFFFCEYFYPPMIRSLENLQLGVVTWFTLWFGSNPLFFFFASLLFTTIVISWLFLSYLGLYGIFFLNLIPLFLFWVSLCLSFESIFINNTVYNIKISSWVFLTPNTRLDYYFLIDSISFSFIFLTTTIALFVLVYAFSYFRYEPLVDRFILFLVSFVISMLFLVASGNTIMLFLGWELIGFTSFCLINFWSTKAATLKSAFKAFTFNKISDFYMFMFLLTTYSTYYTFDILSLNTQSFISTNNAINIFGFNISTIELICFFLLGASFIKSAQFIGHAWLPDSMEAPVPASSLIHSATLVSAGIYLILRFNVFIDMSVFAKYIIPIIGSLTAAYGGVSAIAQSDIKKTLAYSTISHCGFLMVLCALEMNEYTILYLYVHGFFKAGVFMCVGNVLRITRGYQDTRRMGCLFKYLPFEYFMIVIGLLNLAGLPFTFGFFVKHLLLISLDKDIYLYYFVLFNCLVGAFAGLFYSYRLLTYTFNDFKKAPRVTYLTWNSMNANSYYFTGTSKASTIAIVGLYLTAYIVCYLMFKYLVFSNFVLNDFLNTTILASYFTNNNSFTGYLLNFSYINWTVVIIICYFVFAKYRKTEKYNNWVLLSVLLILLVLLTFLFLY